MIHRKKKPDSMLACKKNIEVFYNFKAPVLGFFKESLDPANSQGSMPWLFVRNALAGLSGSAWIIFSNDTQEDVNHPEAVFWEGQVILVGPSPQP